jgi:hypothetical protein
MDKKKKRKKLRDRITYIRLDFQLAGNGRAGFRMTPTFAAPISFARIGASLAPENVNRMYVLRSVSISFLRLINEAMISALCTSITSGSFPCVRMVRIYLRNKGIRYYLLVRHPQSVLPARLYLHLEASSSEQLSGCLH